MKKKQILNVSIDDKENINVVCKDRELAAMVITDYISETAGSGDTSALDMLYSITIHLLARDVHGGFEKEYIENLRREIPNYRKVYKSMIEEMKNNEKPVN